MFLICENGERIFRRFFFFKGNIYIQEKISPEYFGEKKKKSLLLKKKESLLGYIPEFFFWKWITKLFCNSETFENNKKQKTCFQMKCFHKTFPEKCIWIHKEKKNVFFSLKKNHLVWHLKVFFFLLNKCFSSDMFSQMGTDQTKDQQRDKSSLVPRDSVIISKSIKVVSGSNIKPIRKYFHANARNYF